MALSPVYSQMAEVGSALSSYINAVETRITRMVDTSLLFSDVKPEGAVRLKICITPQGLLKDIQVAESSGNAGLDNVVLKGARQAFPFIPFPVETQKSELWLDLSLVFDQTAKKISLSQPVAITGVLTPASPKLEEYIRVALANHQSSRIAQEQIELAKLKINEAERSLYPALSGEYRTAKGKTITDPYESISYGLQAEQLLLGLNQVWDTIQREKLGFQMAQKNVYKLSTDVRYEVTKAYYELAAQAILLKHWQATLKAIKPEMELIRRLYESGLAIAADYENSQSQFNLILYQVVSAESNVSLAKLGLLQAMNLDTSQLDRIEVPTQFDFEAQDLRVKFSDCVDRGLRSRPEIELWQIVSQSAKIYAKISSRENQPKFSLVSSYGRSGEAYASQTLDTIDEWSLMGKFTWLWGPSSLELSQTEDRTFPKAITDTVTKTEASTSDIKFSLLDKLNYYTTKKEAEISYQQAINELNEAKKKVIYEIKEAYSVYLKALIGIQTNLQRLEFRKNEFQVVKARTELGEGSPIDLLEARINLANDNANYLRSLGDYYLSVAALDKATGYHLVIDKSNI